MRDIKTKPEGGLAPKVLHKTIKIPKRLGKAALSGTVERTKRTLDEAAPGMEEESPADSLAQGVDALERAAAKAASNTLHTGKQAVKQTIASAKLRHDVEKQRTASREENCPTTDAGKDRAFHQDRSFERGNVLAGEHTERTGSRENVTPQHNSLYGNGKPSSTSLPKKFPNASVSPSEAATIGKGTIKTKEAGLSRNPIKKKSVGIKAGAPTAGRPARQIKTAHQAAETAKRAKIAAKTGRKAAKHARQAATQMAKKTRLVIRGTIKGVKTTVKAVKGTIALIVAGGWVAVLIIIIVAAVAALLFSVFGSGGSSNGGPQELSQQVLNHTPTIDKYTEQYGIPNFVPVVQAIMMAESGGQGTDPMQSSECPYNTRFPNTPGAITNPDYSIQVGIQYFAACLSEAGCTDPNDLSLLALSLQGYNFGNGYISWAIKNFGGYTEASAYIFSQQQAEAHGWESYGDPEYFQHVFRYIKYTSALPGTGKFLWPVPSCSNITSSYGPRWEKTHKGIDIADANINGKPIVAAADGTVTASVQMGWGGGYGLHVDIDHGDGYMTRYAHASRVIVNQGDHVVKGQVIAYVGSTGDSTGPHCHFEIRLDGEPLDPTTFFVLP